MRPGNADLKTLFSFVIALNFHYFCGKFMRIDYE